MSIRAESEVVVRLGADLSNGPMTKNKTPPGFNGLWLLLTLDLGAFFLYFFAFMLERQGNEALFEQARQSLNIWNAVANTLILLTSSWFVVKAIEGAREGAPRRARQHLQYAIFCGLAFAVLKVWAWAEEIMAGNSITAGAFYGYYFAITGMHFFHALVGLSALALCLHKLRDEVMGHNAVAWITSAGVFWHLVDMLWVMIFPLIYLLRAPQ